MNVNGGGGKIKYCLLWVEELLLCSKACCVQHGQPTIQ